MRFVRQSTRMSSYLSTWLSTLERKPSIDDTTPVTPPSIAVWTFYKDCISLLSKQQSSLALSDFPQEIARNLKDELIRLRLWGAGCHGGQIEDLLDRFLELKETTVSMLLRIGALLIQRIHPFLDLSNSTPDEQDLVQATQQFQFQFALISKSATLPNVADEGFTALHSKHHLPHLAAILPGNPEVQTQLEGRRKSLLPDSPTSHEHSLEQDFDDILEELRTYITALLDLLPSMAHSLDTLARTEAEDPNPFTIKILDKYGDDNRPLKQRLGDVNMERYDRLLSIVHNDAEMTSTEDSKALVPPSKIDSGFYSGTKSKNPKLDPSGKSQTGESSRSLYSFYTSTTTANENNGEARVPTTPDEVKQGLPFTCQICWQSQKGIRSSEDWKFHVFADLEPYVCTHQECGGSKITFRTRKAWFEHEFNEHLAKHHWKCQQCPQAATSPAEMKRHLENAHKLSSLEQIMEALDETKMPGPMPFDIMACPLCFQVPGGGTRQSFISHVCRKLESIALAALPRRLAEDEETRSKFTRRGGSNFESAIPLEESEDWDNAETVATEKSELQISSFPMPFPQSGLGKDPESRSEPESTFDHFDEALGKEFKRDAHAHANKTSTAQEVDADSEMGAGEDIDLENSTSTIKLLSDSEYPPKSTITRKRRSSKASKHPPRPAIKADPKGKGQFACKSCDHAPFKDAAALQLHITRVHTKAFSCVFGFAGCKSTFASKNEWKRHVSSQHLNFSSWVCELQACSKVLCMPKTGETPIKGSVFNRKDLFTQHLRRMHAPFAVKRMQKKNPEWEEKLKELAISCLKVNRLPPTRLLCPVGTCGTVFEGQSCWDDRMEHVGKHLEEAAASAGQYYEVRQEDDTLLVQWALREGIIEVKGNEYRLYIAGRDRVEDEDAEGEEE